MLTSGARCSTRWTVAWYLPRERHPWGHIRRTLGVAVTVLVAATILTSAPAAGDPHDEVVDCWGAKEKIRSICATDDPDLPAERLDDANAWCTEPEAGSELRRLAKTLLRWRTEISATTTPAPATAPSKRRTCSSSRSSPPAAATATSPTTGSASSSPAAPTPCAKPGAHESLDETRGDSHRWVRR